MWLEFIPSTFLYFGHTPPCFELFILCLNKSNVLASRHKEGHFAVGQVWPDEKAVRKPAESNAHPGRHSVCRCNFPQDPKVTTELTTKPPTEAQLEVLGEVAPSTGVMCYKRKNS